MEEQINQQEPQTTITSKEFAAKANSKREIYQLLAQEARAYLPQPTLISIYFLKDLVSGHRKFLKNYDVKHMHVPFYESLSIKELLKWAGENYQEVARFFPILKEQVKLPRQWIINVLFSVIGEDFAQFVIIRTEQRNQEIYIKKDLSVAIDPDVLAAFKSSSLVSIGKSATGASLLKIGSKRKRTKREVQEEKAQQEMKEQQVAQQLENMQQMEQQMQQMQAEIEGNQANSELINNLIQSGAARFDEDGVFNINQNQESSLAQNENA